MSTREPIHTDKAPKAIGPYSQAMQTDALIFLSGQIPLDPRTMELVSEDIEAQTRQVFDNLEAVASAAGSNLNRAVKLTIYLTDLGQFSTVNAIMAERLEEPFPARATLQVSALPKGAAIEIEAVLIR